MQTKAVVETDLIDLGAVSVETRGSNPAIKLDQDQQGYEPVGLSLED